MPIVATDLPQVDAGGFTSDVDGLTRTADALGNTLVLETRHGVTTLAYDGLSRLRRATRADGSVIDYEYRADGMLAYRKVACDPTAVDCVSTERFYAYEGLHLLQEVEKVPNGGLEVVAQYYYTDESDIPAAADLRAAPGAALNRYYFLVDRQGSVIAVVDDQGNEQERTWYDVFGEPRIEGADNVPAHIESLTGFPEGDLQVRFSEPVFPRGTFLGSGSAVVLTGVFQVEDGNATAIPVTAVATPVVVGARPGEVYHLTLQAPLQDGVAYTLRLGPGLVDTWNNPVVVLGVAFTYSSAGTFYQSAAGYTGPPELTRSALRNVAGFQAHMYDFDAGLIHMRGRVFDPRTGMFLQRDPEGYEDSVNLYAGFGWNPVGMRDPTGTTVVGYVYIIRGFINGEAVTYVGSTDDISRRLIRDTHKWKALIKDPRTSILSKPVHATLDRKASGQGTWGSAVREALNSKENQVLREERARVAKHNARLPASRRINILNSQDSPPTSDINETIFAERHQAALGKGPWRRFKRGSGRTRFRGAGLAMGGVFITLDLLGHVRAANSEGQVDAPLLLADDNGVFMLQSGWWGGYRKKYVDGRLSGASVEIDVAEFERLREIAYLIFGRRDFFGRWQPGMLQKELPLISLPYPECVEVGVACEA